MKQFFLLSLLLLATSCCGSFAQSPKDTTALRRSYDSLIKAADALRKAAKGSDSAAMLRSADTLQLKAAAVLDSLKKATLAGTAKQDTAAKAKQPCDCIPSDKAACLGIGEWLLVYTPLLLFLILGGFAARRLKEFSIKDALSENFGGKVTVMNPVYDAKNLGLQPGTNANPPSNNIIALIPPTIELSPEYAPVSGGTQPSKTEYRPSISRLIALLSSLVIIILAISMSCLFIYRYIAYGCPPDFSNLTAILLALGVGIVPYAVNKAANASTSKNV